MLKSKSGFLFFVLSFLLFAAQGRAEDGRRVGAQGFHELLRYAEGYLKENAAHLGVYRNVSGFVRVSIPPPAETSAQIKEIRFNYWLPEAPIQAESIHSHPQYFEGIVLNGGYAHELYRRDGDAASSEKKVYRVYKRGGVKTCFHLLEETRLTSLGARVVTQGAIASFPRSMIHRIVVAEPYTLTMNVVFREESGETCFDVFTSQGFDESDLKIERDFLSQEESMSKIFEMVDILHRHLEVTPDAQGTFAIAS
jgi:hypothetical protein